MDREPLPKNVRRLPTEVLEPGRLAAGSRLWSLHVTHSVRVLTAVRSFLDPAAKAPAVLHVDDVTVGGQAIVQGGRQLGILQKRSPFAEALQRRQLTDAQRERMDSAEFYELLRQQITARVTAIKKA